MRIGIKVVYRITMCMLLLSILVCIYRYFHGSDRQVVLIAINAVTPLFVLFYLLALLVKYKKDQKALKRRFKE